MHGNGVYAIIKYVLVAMIDYLACLIYICKYYLPRNLLNFEDA
jgi:hypothetical protein